MQHMLYHVANWCMLNHGIWLLKLGWHLHCWA